MSNAENRELRRQLDKLLASYNELVLDHAETQRQLQDVLAAIADASKKTKYRREPMDPAVLYAVRCMSRFDFRGL